jgi:hypothetical protein
MGGYARYPAKLLGRRLRAALVLSGAQVAAEDAFFGDDLLMQIDDGLALTTSFELSFIYALRETLTVNTTVTGVATFFATLRDTLDLDDSIVLILSATVNDSLAITGAASGSTSVLMALVDTMLLTDDTLTTLRALGIINDTLALLGTNNSVQLGTLNDSVNLAQSITALVSAYEELTATAAFSDSALSVSRFTAVISDDFNLDDTVNPLATLLARINDTMGLAISFVFDDVPYVGLVMNAETHGFSQYDNYAFNSIAVFGGQLYGANTDGLYLLDGEDDDGDEIAWRIRTGLDKFNSSLMKGLDSAYLGYTATGRVALKCIVVNHAGDKIVHWYELTGLDKEASSPGKIQIGRGLKSVYWGFELTNVDAGDIALDVLELHPLKLDRRLR